MKELKYVTMVDKKKCHSNAALLDMMVREGMTPQLEAGVRGFVLECTSSYNVASRKYSIWSLLSKHVDVPLAESLNKLGIPHLFDGPFSKWLHNRRMAEMSRFFKTILRSNQKCPELIANIESLIEVSYHTLAKRPSKKIAVAGEKGSPQLNHRKQVDHRHYPYCELCWQLSQAAERNVDNPEKSSATQRFCNDHNPSVQSSKYRNDHRFRDRFHEELRRVKSDRHQKFIDEAALRLQAYKNAHRRVASLHNEIIQLHEKGLKQSEISRQLSITRQAVSKSLKTQNSTRNP